MGIRIIILSSNLKEKPFRSRNCQKMRDLRKQEHLKPILTTKTHRYLLPTRTLRLWILLHKKSSGPKIQIGILQPFNSKELSGSSISKTMRVLVSTTRRKLSKTSWINLMGFRLRNWVNREKDESILRKSCMTFSNRSTISSPKWLSKMDLKPESLSWKTSKSWESQSWAIWSN